MKKDRFRTVFFSIQSEGLACNLTAGEYVIAEGVWHHASACILLRIDYIQHFVLIPYRRQAADFIHGFAVILRVAFFLPLADQSYDLLVQKRKDKKEEDYRIVTVKKYREIDAK